MVMREVLPYLLQAGAEVGKEFLISSVRAHFSEHVTMHLTPAQNDSPAEAHGCPYCAVAKKIGVVYFYLQRASRRPTFAGIYTELSRSAIGEAIEILDKMPGEPDVPTMRLSEQLVKMEVALSRPVAAPNFAALTEAIADILEFDMDLAERFNAAKTTGDELADRVEHRLQRFAVADGVPENVIEGESRVIA